MHTRLSDTRPTITVEPTLECVAVMGREEIYGWVFDLRGGDIRIHPITVDVDGLASTKEPIMFFRQALYSRRLVEDAEVIDVLRPDPRWGQLQAKLIAEYGDFQGDGSQLESIEWKIQGMCSAQLHAVYDDTEALREYWDVTSDKWVDGHLGDWPDDDIPF
jgi:hypothetical protein